MALSGDFRAMSAAELLQFLSLNQKSGTLHLSNGHRTLTLVIGSGRLLSSGSSDPYFHLGAYLERTGKITADDRRSASQLQSESNMSLGAMLVEIGLLTRAELLKTVRQKAEEEVTDVLHWDVAEFVFQPDEQPTVETHALQLDLLALIMEAGRRRDESERVAAEKAVSPKPPPDLSAQEAKQRSTPLYFALQSRGSALRSYHLQGCRKAHATSADATVNFASKLEAERLGLQPCKSCHP
jgi:hypothetical protein